MGGVHEIFTVCRVGGDVTSVLVGGGGGSVER